MAGAAVSSLISRNRKRTYPARRGAKKDPSKAPPVFGARITDVEFDPRAAVSLVFHGEYGAVVICGDETGQRAFLLGSSVKELRCPQGIVWAAAGETRTLFLTERGGVFVSPDPGTEPVFCALTAPEYACGFGGRFYIFSDCLLYICTEEGEIEKTVSLSALIPDAEISFAAARAGVKKICPLGKTGQFAVITESCRSYIMRSGDNGFFVFERTCDNIIDVCVYGSFAYYLYKDAEGCAVFKTALSGGSCGTKSCYRLCGSDKLPVRIFSLDRGIGVLFEDGQTRLLLPGTNDKAAAEKARAELSALKRALSGLKAESVFSLPDACGVLCADGIKIISCTGNRKPDPSLQ